MQTVSSPPDPESSEEEPASSEEPESKGVEAPASCEDVEPAS